MLYISGAFFFGYKSIIFGFKKTASILFTSGFKPNNQILMFYFQPPPRALYNWMIALYCWNLLSIKLSSAFKALSFTVKTSR